MVVVGAVGCCYLPKGGCTSSRGSRRGARRCGSSRRSRPTWATNAVLCCEDVAAAYDGAGAGYRAALCQACGAVGVLEARRVDAAVGAREGEGGVLDGVGRVVARNRGRGLDWCR